MSANHKFAGHWQINLKGWKLIFLLVGSVLLFGLSFILGGAIRGLLRGYPPDMQITFGGIFVLLAIIIAVSILHETVHGILFLVFGSKPRFGVKLVGRFFPVALYATSRAPILKNQFLMVILAPFFTLTLVLGGISILVNNEVVVILAIIAMAINVGGSIGDLLTAWKIWRHDRKTLYEDTENGFNWYVPSKSNR